MPSLGETPAALRIIAVGLAEAGEAVVDLLPAEVLAAALKRLGDALDVGRGRERL